MPNKRVDYELAFSKFTVNVTKSISTNKIVNILKVKIEKKSFILFAVAALKKLFFNFIGRSKRIQ